ncbi:MAG: hypothetical protein ABEI80_00455 [Haloplanus sp.]
MRLSGSTPADGTDERTPTPGHGGTATAPPAEGTPVETTPREAVGLDP